MFVSGRRTVEAALPLLRVEVVVEVGATATALLLGFAAVAALRFFEACIAVAGFGVDAPLSFAVVGPSLIAENLDSPIFDERLDSASAAVRFVSDFAGAVYSKSMSWSSA